MAMKPDDSVFDRVRGLAAEPVRLYWLVSAVLALVVLYVPGLPVAAIAGILAALLGVGGEVTRRHTTPAANLERAEAELDANRKTLDAVDRLRETAEEHHARTGVAPPPAQTYRGPGTQTFTQ